MFTLSCFLKKEPHVKIDKLNNQWKFSPTSGGLATGVGEDNPASLALFKAAGYEQCGLKKDWNYYNKEYHNEVVFQKIAHV